MSAQFFPNIEQVMDVLMAELPDGVYPTDRADDPNPDKRSVSSSEIRAHAQVFANLYSNLRVINEDKFISTVTQDGLARWEVELFSAIQDGTLPFAVRKANLIAKIRAYGSINLPTIEGIVAGVLGPIPFAILPYGGAFNGTEYGAWIFGFSQLGLDTFLGLRDPLWGAQQDFVPLDCDLDYAAAGITAQDLAEIQATAYTYEVQIYGNASADTLTQLDLLLTQHEPARSTHIIRNNATGPVPPT